jgi:hypothetical protein
VTCLEHPGSRVLVRCDRCDRHFTAAPLPLERRAHMARASCTCGRSWTEEEVAAWPCAACAVLAVRAELAARYPTLVEAFLATAVLVASVAGRSTLEADILACRTLRTFAENGPPPRARWVPGLLSEVDYPHMVRELLKLSARGRAPA